MRGREAVRLAGRQDPRRQGLGWLGYVRLPLACERNITVDMHNGIYVYLRI